MRLLIVALLNFYHPGAATAADPKVVEALAEVARYATREEIALITEYAWLESGAQVKPHPYSWDARAGVSCGYLQEPCGVVARLNLVEQGYYWLHELRTAGLAALDSSKARAERRLARAHDAMAVIQ